MKQVVSIALAASALIVALPASAQVQKPRDAVKDRQSAFAVVGGHFSRLGAMGNCRVAFDAKVAQDNAAWSRP